MRKLQAKLKPRFRVGACVSGSRHPSADIKNFAFSGTCAGACSDTCTPDGRKYDELAGVGGERATCVNDNFMCLPDDPYYGDFSVLVHEFAHTLHYYALPYSTDLLERVSYTQQVKTAREDSWPENERSCS